MKCVVEIEPVCPFIGLKQCRKDGWEFGSKVLHPCAFYDSDVIYSSEYPQEPCMIKRAVNKILSDEITDNPTDAELYVPWETEEEGDNNGE